MKYILLLQWITVCMSVWSNTNASCPRSVVSTFPFILEYSVWRGWTQTLLYTPKLEWECHRHIIKLSKCLNVNGAGVSWVKTKPRLQHHQQQAVVVVSPALTANGSETLVLLFKELVEMELNNGHYDWLITARSVHDFRSITKVFNVTTLRFDQNVAVAFPNGKTKTNPDICQNYFDSKIVKNGRPPNSTKYSFNSRNSFLKPSPNFRNLVKDQTYQRLGKYVPLLRSGSVIGYDYTKKFVMENMTAILNKKGGIDDLHYMKHRKNRKDHDFHVLLVQYFKVRENSTLYGHYLGPWHPNRSMSQVDPPYPVEARTFLGEELNVGRCNSSDDGLVKDEATSAAAPNAPVLLDDILPFLADKFNATLSVKFYSKLGFRSFEGTWTGLLGALVDNTVDLALEPVTTNPASYDDLDFIFPIAATMSNIYIRQQETSTVRDIFLAPFSWRLVVCVVAVAVAAAAAIFIITRVSPAGARHMEFSEAMVWSTGILCQQGVNHSPQSPSASTLLVCCLLFAVVTYNAYAAFITSVLSVRVASVDTLAAVLHSNRFRIGYIRNGPDQMYLMSTKDAQLNAFYIRGYLSAENLVSTAEEGLTRAASSDYAFFSEQRVARSTVKLLSQARGRCALRELAIPSTRAHLAFPMAKGSPYARLTLVSLLELRTSGAISRLGANLIPPMPTCDSPSGFASARAADVRSALLLIAAGLALSGCIGFFEYCWKYRSSIRAYFSRKYRSIAEIFYY